MFAANGRFAYAADYAEPISVNSAPGRFQAEQFGRVRDHCQAVVIEAGRPLFGRLFGYAAAREALALETAGLAVAALWHGSDIRLPSHHIARHPLSPYALPELRARAGELESNARRNRRAMGALGLAQLVSTPDLLDQVEGAIWCPVVVAQALIQAGAGAPPAAPPAPGAGVDVALAAPLGDAAAAPPAPVLAGPRPRVVHVPSNPLLKGSDLVDPILQRLAGEGRIDYIRAEGLTSAEVCRLYGEADIVADQFRMGIYGVAAVEAMALGRLVISDVDTSVQEAVLDQTGLALPIAKAGAAGLAAELDRIIADPDPYRRLAAQGPPFVAAVHSGARSAAALAQALGLGN
jgi:hypothetical protein